uniref:USP domain-containing protein n=1 Tax=Parascaris univalens TaxID=6257 RepID=A0A915ANS2_PARUN
MFEPQAGGGDQVVMDLPTDNPNTAVPIPEGGFALLSHTAQNASLTNAVTALSFDPYEELLWSGNTASRVVSFFGTQLDKYTAFISAQTDVRSLLITESTVLSLTAQRLKANRRQGISLFSHSSEHMTDLTCMHRLADAPHTVLLGGDQSKIVQLDLETQKEARIVHLKQKNCLALRSNQKFLFSADSDGNVTLRHLSTIDAIHALQAHQGAIADFDVYGNKLITCGYSPRMGTLTGDRFLMVYDLRTLRSLPLVPLPIAPSFCRFLPSYSDSRIMVASQAGELIVMDLNDQTGQQIPIQLDTNGFAIFSLDVSPSRQCIAFGDQTGFIHLFSDRAQPVFNENAWETEFPDPVVMHPAMGIDDLLPPFAVFPLPFSTDDSYLSDWPEQLCQRFYRQPDPIPQQTIDSMRMVQFVGYAPNPRADTPLRAFNIQPYSNLSSTLHKVNTASEQPIRDTSPQAIPKFYRRVHVRPSRYNSEEFDYLRYNRTELIPIESQPSLPQANAILLALFHISEIRNIFLQHLCFEVDCLSCEVGFLFRMLADRVPLQPASASNFVRCLRSVDEGGRLFDDKAHTSLLLRTRSFAQFLSNRLSEELGELAAGVEYRKCFETTFALNNRCVRCSEQYQSTEKRFSLKVAYPASGDNVAFCNVLEKSLNCPEQSDALCQKCGKMARVTSTRRVRSLPNVLVVDTSATNQAERAFWTSQLQAFEKRPPPRLNSSQSSSSLERFQKTCRYGDDCKKPFCKYNHSAEGKNEVSSDCEDFSTSLGQPGEECEWTHYIPAAINIKMADGICTVSETVHESSTCFVLRCAVFAVGDGSDMEPTHLVTAVKVKPADRGNTLLSPLAGSSKMKERGWVVFNEFVVTRVTENEALHLDANWKLPCILYYAQLESDPQNVEIRAPIPAAVFWTDFGNLGAQQTRLMISEETLPKNGELVAIDAEFIALNKEGTRAVARVSCVREDGTCFLDDYIRPSNSDTVSDYLTAWSGIEAADLDPELSTRHLISLKGTYLKLLYLLQQGVIFVGHGLSSDFNALSIYVPSDQMRDTVHLFYLPGQRMISLQFLAWYLFEESIQQTAHDSVEDARMAFRLYKKYLELSENGKLQSVITELYEAGKRLNWKMNGSPLQADIA